MRKFIVAVLVFSFLGTMAGKAEAKGPFRTWLAEKRAERQATCQSCGTSSAPATATQSSSQPFSLHPVQTAAYYSGRVLGKASGVLTGFGCSGGSCGR